jgi:hypothetical protein
MANKQVRFPEFEEFAHNDQTIAGDDRFAKADFIESTETDHRIPQEFVFVSAVATDLSDCLKHDNSWHQRHAWHVTSDPKFISRDIFVPSTHNVHGVFVDDRSELLHFEALWVKLANLMNIRSWTIKIDLIQIDDEFFRNH